MTGPDSRIDEALTWAKQQLQDSDSAAVDARLLLSHVLDVNTTYLLTWPDKTINSDQLAQFRVLIERRKEGYPVAHLVGHRDFWTLRLKVSPHTLIPRPETELMVELALELTLPERAKVLDLGTGTGAIALALASERPKWQVMGVDLVSQAVELAKENAVIHRLDNVSIAQSDWFSAVDQQQFDLIVSNPPYVEEDSPYLRQGDVRFEPASALTAGEDGLDDIRQIVGRALPFLAPGGWIMFEHGFEQGPAVQSLLIQSGLTGVQTRNDLNNHGRITFGKAID